MECSFKNGVPSWNSPKKKKWFHLVKPCVLKLSQNILTEHVNHSVTHPYTATESEHIHILPSLDTDII